MRSDARVSAEIMRPRPAQSRTVKACVMQIGLGVWLIQSVTGANESHLLEALEVHIRIRWPGLGPLGPSRGVLLHHRVEGAKSGRNPTGEMIDERCYDRECTAAGF